MAIIKKTENSNVDDNVEKFKELMAFLGENYRKKRRYLARALKESSVGRRIRIVWQPEVKL